MGDNLQKIAIKAWYQTWCKKTNRGNGNMGESIFELLKDFDNTFAPNPAAPQADRSDEAGNK